MPSMSPTHWGLGAGSATPACWARFIRGLEAVGPAHVCLLTAPWGAGSTSHCAQQSPANSLRAKHHL